METGSFKDIHITIVKCLNWSHIVVYIMSSCSDCAWKLKFGRVNGKVLFGISQENDENKTLMKYCGESVVIVMPSLDIKVNCLLYNG